jgi:HK97 gp10 family phage protein
MPNIELKIEGLKELKERLNKYPNISRPIFAKAINFSLAEIVYNARDQQFLFKTPRSERTGYLELSFSEASAMVRATPDRLQGKIGPTANYAIYVHEGTEKMSANPFMLRIMQKSQIKIDELFKKALENITKELSN